MPAPLPLPAGCASPEATTATSAGGGSCMMAAAVAADPVSRAAAGCGCASGIGGISCCPVSVLAKDPWRSVCRVLPLFSAPLLSLAARGSGDMLATAAMSCFAGGVACGTPSAGHTGPDVLCIVHAGGRVPAIDEMMRCGKSLPAEVCGVPECCPAEQPRSGLGGQLLPSFPQLLGPDVPFQVYKIADWSGGLLTYSVL